MKTRFYLFIFWFALFAALPIMAADNLQLNKSLNYQSDSLDGPLITGDHLSAGAVMGKPNYIIIYGEGCFNSKRQGRRTVELYNTFKSRVNFVVVDLDQRRAPDQQQLVRKYYQGYIPQVTILDQSGHAVYNRAGEVGVKQVTEILDKALQ